MSATEQQWNEWVAQFYRMEVRQRERIVPSTSRDFADPSDTHVVPSVPEVRDGNAEDLELPESDREVRRVPTLNIPVLPQPRRLTPLDEFLQALALECGDRDGPQVVPIAPTPTPTPPASSPDDFQTSASRSGTSHS